MKTFQYNTIENKIEFLTAILDVLTSKNIRMPWLCLIAEDLHDCSLMNTDLEYVKFIQNQLIEDGKLTEKQSNEHLPGFNYDGKVTKETYSVRIKYLQDKIKFFQDQLNQQKETKTVQYQFEIGDIVELSDLGKDRPKYGMQRPLTGKISQITKWSNSPAYYVEYSKSGNIEKPECSGIFLEEEIQIAKKAKKAKHIPIGRKYQKTIDTSGWSNEQFNTLHRGQWVSNFGGTGQFLGITPRGAVTINYKQTRDLKKQYAANQPLRQFVKLHGGK